MKLRHVTTKYVVDATDQPVLRDKKRNKFRPKDVIISHRSDRGFWHVRVFGYSTGPAAWGTEAIWVISETRIQANNVGRAPQWLQDAVDQAVALHSGEPEAQAQAQATGAINLCCCHWLGAGTPAHARTAFCPEVR